MQETDYVRSHDYEGFIRLSRLCGREEFGAHNQNMLNLIWKEQGNSAVNHLKNDLLADAKKYMTSATKFAMKRNLDKADKEQVKNYLTRIDLAKTSDDLLEICKEGIEVFVKYKPSS